MKKMILISFAVVLISCVNSVKRNNEDKSIQAISDFIAIEHTELIKQIQDFGYLKATGDSLEIPFFEIELTLSEKAEEKLKADNESVIVIAYFAGTVNDENNIPEKYKEKVEFGRLHLLEYPIELTDERLAIFKNIKFPKDLYDLLEDKDIELLINVVSGRRTTNRNFLSCDIIAEPMSRVKEKRFTIKGKLIGE